MRIVTSSPPEGDADNPIGTLFDAARSARRAHRRRFNAQRGMD